MRWPDGRYIQASIFFSRWLLAPFLLGLLLCLLLLIYRFFADFSCLRCRCRALNWHDLVTGVLNLVDLALTANLILIVIFSGYENFIRRIDAAAHPDWPEGLTQVDFGALKQKLLGSIVGIAAVDALAWYFDLEKVHRYVEAGLGAGFPGDLRRRHGAVAVRRLADRPPQGQDRVSAWPCRQQPGAGEGLLTIPGVNQASTLARTGSDCAMRVTRPLLLLFALAVAVAGCARQPAMRVQMAAAPAPYGIDNVVYGSAPPAYAAPARAPASWRRPTQWPRPITAWRPRPPMRPPSPASRGIFAPTYVAATPRYGVATAPAYATVAAPSYRVMAAPAPAYATAAATYAAVAAPGYGARSYGARSYDGRRAGDRRAARPGPYTLDSGDRLRIVVFGQDGLTNSYVVDASGDIAMPLIGSVAARGLTTDQLSARIADLLRQGYVRDPHVAVEIEAYRPFFILGEVTQPGPISLRRQHDGGDGGGDRRRLRPARLQEIRHHQPQLRRPSLSVRDADHAPRSDPATRSRCRSAGSNEVGRQNPDDG